MIVVTIMRSPLRQIPMRMPRPETSLCVLKGTTTLSRELRLRACLEDLVAWYPIAKKRES
jgi:hypothetical protein